MNEDKIFDIEFEHGGKHYKGWANPSEKMHDDGLPVSFHVVLNNVSFGYVSFSNNQWTPDEWRPEGMAEAIGKEIEQRYQINLK